MNKNMSAGCRICVATFAAAFIVLASGCGSGSKSTITPPPPPPPTVGASVNEALETVTVYVDPAGSDSNNGSQTSPFQTINKALALAGSNNQSGVGTQISVNPGLYREQLSIPSSNTSLPFTLQAAKPGTVFISGADSFPGGNWTAAPAYGPNVYTNAATSAYVYAACATPAGWPPVPPIVLRREMVFVNGTHLNQVLFSNELRPGTFWADSGANPQIYIWPPGGTNMGTADVEVSTSSRSPLLMTNHTNNFVIRNLTFEYDNSCVESGSRVNNGSNILIDTDQFLWSNSVGFGFYGGTTPVENITVQNTKADHNGQIGFSGTEVKYGLYQNDDSSYNSWRGALGGFYSFAFDGSDFFLHHNSNFSNMTAYYNVSSGIHFDTDNANDEVTSMQAGGNNLEGLLVEASEGPFSVQNSTFCSNSLVPASKTGNVIVDDSSAVTLTGNTLYDSAPEQIYIEGDGRAGTNWEQPTVPLVRFNQNLTQTGNTITGTASQLGFYTSYTDTPSCSVLVSDMWKTFGGTLSSQSNTWGDTAATKASFPFFQAAILNGTVPFSAWQSGTGQDTQSTFVPQAQAPQQCTLPQPDAPDFWLVAGPRTGAAAVAPTAGGPPIQVPLYLVSLGFTGNVSLSLDTIQQEGGSPISGVSGTFSPQALALSSNSTLTPVPTTLTISTTSSTPDGFYPLTITASDGNGITRTGVVILQVGSATALQFSGPATTIQAGTCSIFQIRSVDSSGSPSEVLSDTYLEASGTGSGKFYQDEHCSTPVSFAPVNSGCPAGVEIPTGEYAPHFSGTESIWFMDTAAETLNIKITDVAGVLQSATASIVVQ